MGDISFVPFVLLLAFVSLFIGARPFFDRFVGAGERTLSQLCDELMDRTRVFSAETTTRAEAEFIRDWPRRWWPSLALLVACIIGGALLWLLMAN